MMAEVIESLKIAFFSAQDIDRILKRAVILYFAVCLTLKFGGGEISDKAILPVIFGGIGLNFWTYKLNGLINSVLGISLGFSLIIFWILKVIRLDTVKLYMAIGAMGGWKFCLNVMFTVLLILIIGFLLISFIPSSNSEEENVEEKIASLKKILASEPKNVDIYHELANIYIEEAWFDPDKLLIEEAMEILEKGYKELPDSDLKQSIRDIYEAAVSYAELEDNDLLIKYYIKYVQFFPEKIEELADVYLKMGKFEEAKDLLKSGLERVKEKEKIENKLKEIKEIEIKCARKKEIKRKYMDKIYRLIQYIDKHNGQLNNKVLMDEGFNNITLRLEEAIIEKYNGKDIGIYPGGYIYYGRMDNEKREGKGIWILCEKIGRGGKYPYYFLFSGNWKDNYPNGKGELFQVTFNADGTLISAIKDQGKCVEGYLEGRVTTVIFDENKEKRTFCYKANNGKPKTIKSRRYNQKIIAYAKEDKNCVWKATGKEVLGVYGAMKY